MSSNGLKKTAICLLRNDLRFHDNEVLHWACANADHILPLYCFDPRHYGGTHHFNLPRTGSHRFKFLLQTVQELRAMLKGHGSNLIVHCGKPEVVIPDIIKKISHVTNVTHLVYQEEATKEETDVESALKQISGVTVKSIWGSTLYNKDDLPFKLSQTPDVFTQFRKRVEDQSEVRPLIDMPQQLKPLPPDIEPGKIPNYEDFKIKEQKDDSRSTFPFAGGELAALQRLQYYLWGTDQITKYIDTRNGMIGPDFSTKFSPWLANGSLSPRKIYWDVKKYQIERVSTKSTYWVIFELTWRDYFKFVALKFGTKLFHLSGLMGKNVEWKQDLELFNAWKDGCTGVPYVDANMRELLATGFMSNRGRQNVASFLTKDLRLDWRMGAEWFESQLVDHDVCSNYGNWLYSAGIGNDPRQDRKFNMIKQGTDYDKEGEYVRLWIAELGGIRGRDAHVPWTLSKAVLTQAGVEIPGSYPKPVVIAPEWSRHIRGGGENGAGRNPQHPGSRRPQYSRGGGGGRDGGQKPQRGMDYYFSKP